MIDEQMIADLRGLNTQLGQLLDATFKTPMVSVALERDNEAEALRLAIAVRLNLLKRALERRGILAAGDLEILRLDQRIHELVGSGVADPDDVVVPQIQ